MHFELSRDQLTQLLDGAVAAPAPAAVFRIAGPGALDCLQGLLTNDLAEPGSNSLVYGALLTPKGMIVVDAWVLRLSDGFLFLCDESGRERVSGVFHRSLPPRLARVTDLSDEWTVLWLVGKSSPAVLAAAGLESLPGPGVVAEMAGGPLLASGTPAAPFAGLIVGDRTAVTRIQSALLAAGASEGSQTMIGAALVLAGWPALGREIEERTLPQEVRFDEHHGVSYSKGCYTGQETVARIHFRGHVNRVLRGVLFDGDGSLEDVRVTVGEREVGTVHSSTSAGGQLFGLAVLRREVEEGNDVLAGGRKGRVVSLPFNDPLALRP